MIRLLVASDAAAYAALRREALVQSPLAFASSPQDDIAAHVDSAGEQLKRAPESVIFGAFDGDLVGSIGIYRDRHEKCAHKTHIWGMYVKPAHRRRGVARSLLDAALRHAALQTGVKLVHLSVSSSALEARHLYEAAGFELWGIEPDSLRHNGDSADEHHMVLSLENYDR